MKVLIVGRLLEGVEWLDLNDSLWDNPDLFFTQKEFELVDIEIKKPLENNNVVSYKGSDYIVKKSFDIKDELQGYIFLNFQSSFFINKDKDGFCSGCTSTDLYSKGDVPFGELTRKQLDKIIDKNNTTYCGNCHTIVTYRESPRESVIISPVRKRRV